MGVAQNKTAGVTQALTFGFIYQLRSYFGYMFLSHSHRNPTIILLNINKMASDSISLYR